MSRKGYKCAGLSPTHEAVLGFVKPGSRVLEVGCSSGHMTKALREDLGCTITAIEINEEEAREASQFANQTTVGDIQDLSVWNQLDGLYDAVLFADVLEHLANPWEVLTRVKQVLSNEGMVVASMPNVAYYRIRKELLLGRFDYATYGILDDSHLRFFTRKTMLEMFTRTGYQVTDCVRRFRVQTDRRIWRLMPDAFTYQFVIRAVPAVAAEAGESVCGTCPIPD